MLKSKTIWFALATAALGLFEQVAQFIPPDADGWVMVAIAGVTAALRVATKKPLGDK